MNKLDYVSTPAPEDALYKISPSSFASFINRPWQWHRQQILKLDQFEYNTSSVIGTIVHYCAEQVAKDEEVDQEEIENYILSFENKEDFSQDEVRLHWYQMASLLINDYVLPEKNTILAAEKQCCAEIGNKIYVAGTSDVIQGTEQDAMIVDYKTYNSKTEPKSISGDYKQQLLVYCWILMKMGYNVTRIRLVYVSRNIDGGISEKTGKPLKSYPPKLTVLTETVTEDDMAFIDSMLNLAKDTLLVSDKHPELRHIMWHDPRLLENS